MNDEPTLFLCSAEVDLDVRDSSGFAALHYAVKAGSPEAIQILIDNGADKEVRSTLDTKFLTPALLAVVEGQVDCLEKLLENKVDLLVESSTNYPDYYNDNQKTEDYGVFALCVVHNQPKCLESLVLLDEDDYEWRNLEKAENAVHGKQRGTILGLAVKLNRIECLKILLDEDFSPGKDSDDLNHALCLAAEYGNSECLYMLLEYDCHFDIIHNEDCTKVEQRTLLFAVLRNDEQMLEVLVENDFQIDLYDGNMSALHAAAAQGNVKCLKFILDHMVPIPGDPIRLSENELRAEDGYGKSALWYAAIRGHPECIGILIGAGAWPSTFEDGLDIVACTKGHQHYCVSCQKKQTCVCYGTRNECQVNNVDHDILECQYKKRYDPDSCTEDCNCDLNMTIKMLCTYALGRYGEENEVGQQRISQILNKAMNACICTDQPETLKWVLSQGADPTESVTLPPDGIAYPLFAAVDAESVQCFKVLLEYGRSFLPEKSPIPDDHLTSLHPIEYFPYPEETILYYAMTDGIKADREAYVKSLYDAGLDLNQRHPNPSPDRYSPPILQAINLGFYDLDCAKQMLSLGVSATLHFDEKVILTPPSNCRTDLNEMLAKAKLLLAAGFDRAKVLSNFDANIAWRNRESAIMGGPLRLRKKDHDRIEEFVAKMTTNRSLQELSRDAIGEHLMTIHPNTNLFHLMPQLVLPWHAFWMKDFLLSGIKL